MSPKGASTEFVMNERIGWWCPDTNHKDSPGLGNLLKLGLLKFWMAMVFPGCYGKVTSI